MPLINPFQKKVCPFCYHRFYLADCAVLSAETVDPQTNQRKVLRPVPKNLNRAVGQFWIPRLSGTANFHERAYRQCPNDKCHQPLPYNIANHENLVIGLVGPRASGKSHYLASLIYTMRERIQLRKIECNEFMPLTGDVERDYINNYYKPLFVNKQMLSITNVADKDNPYRPLIYTATFEQTRSWSGDNGAQSQPGPAWARRKTVNIVFFDVSGEQLQDETEMVRFASFFVHASGFILLVDPTAIPEFSQQLLPQFRPNQPGELALTVIENLIRKVREFKNLSPGESIPVPAVITLAKSDLLAYVLKEGRNHSLLRENYANGFDVAEYEARSREIATLLSDLGIHALLNKAEVFSDYSFSAVSATGTTADDTQHFKFVNPIRCPDPLLWLLWKIGFITPNPTLVPASSSISVKGAQTRG